MLTDKEKMLMADEPYTCYSVLKMHTAELLKRMSDHLTDGNMLEIDNQLGLLRALSIVTAHIKEEYALND